MTEIDMKNLSELCERQFGGKADAYLETFTDWGGKRWNAVIFDDACKAVMEMAADDATPARPNGRYICKTILRRCLKTPIFSRRKGDAIQYPACNVCNRSGFVYVPHRNDWIVGGEFWNGEHTMVVACMCEAGQRFHGMHRTIESYEREFTHWRREYPVRYLERIISLSLPGGVIAAEKLKAIYAQQPQEESPHVSEGQTGGSEPGRSDDSTSQEP